MVDFRRVAVELRNPAHLTGFGFLAGSLPVSAGQDVPDGRFRIMNVPSVGRVVAVERSTFRIAGSALSRSDGTWRIEGLPLDVFFLVVGLDDRGNYNAAVQDWVKAAPMRP